MEVILDLKACPYCGAENPGVMDGIAKKEIEMGKMSEGVIGCIIVSVYTMIDPMKPPLAGARIPAVRTYTDLCEKCGRAVNLRMEKGHATLPLRQGDVPTFA